MQIVWDGKTMAARKRRLNWWCRLIIFFFPPSFLTFAFSSASLMVMIDYVASFFRSSFLQLHSCFWCEIRWQWTGKGKLISSFCSYPLDYCSSLLAGVKDRSAAVPRKWSNMGVVESEKWNFYSKLDSIAACLWSFSVPITFVISQRFRDELKSSAGFKTCFFFIQHIS